MVKRCERCSETISDSGELGTVLYDDYEFLDNAPIGVHGIDLCEQCASAFEDWMGWTDTDGGSPSKTPGPFTQGAVYDIDELPENEMNDSGKLEWVGDNRLGLVTNDIVADFEWSHVRCIDIQFLDVSGNLHDEPPADHPVITDLDV